MNNLLLAAALLLAPGLAQAGGVAAIDAWSPAAPPAATVHAAFFTLVNDGDRTRSLAGVSAAGYAMARIHETRMSGGVMAMTAVDQVDIPAGARIMFQPGGLHVMLIKPQGARHPGDDVRLTLEFADGETVPVTATVRMDHVKTTHGGS